MKQKILLAIFATILLMQNLRSQGFIYAHLKHISEEASPNYFFTLTGTGGTVIDTFSLSDQASANGVPLASNLYVYDMGLSHGTGGDGQLWVVANTSWQAIINSTTVTGSVYGRAAGSSRWVPAPITAGGTVTGARFIDGAYAKQFVYSTTTGVYFYYNGTVTTLLSGGTNVGDVTCNNGRVAAVINGFISVYSNSYTTTAAPATGGTWSTGPSTGNNSSRIDMNVGATLIACEIPGSNTVYTTPLTGTTGTSIGNAGDSKSGYCDVAYDDLGTLYATAYSNTYGSDQIFRNTSGTTWTAEASSRDQETITGGAAHLVYSVNNQDSKSVESIMSRQVDNAGNIYWIDDERVKSSSAVAGNGVVVPVTPGTYTLTETLPSTSYDLGRYNIYDPGGSTTGNVNTQTITFVVTANEVVFGEYVNEALNPKVIAGNCTTQYLQTFDASNSTLTTAHPALTYTYGSGTYGTQLEGTAYHYYAGGSPNDGYYYLTKTADGTNWFQNPGLSDHTGNGGYFLLLNASYAKDEFYRQRVTGLIPGLSYTISFWGANASPTAAILPNITYGLQDTLGNVVNSATTANITGIISGNNWQLFSFTFTATTSRADLFISNNSIGGNGNDLAIDDISINPVIVPLPGITVTPAIAPNICIGTNYTFKNTQAGGSWTSSNTSAATINVSSGRARGIAAGSSEITYSYTNAIGCVSTQNTSIIVSVPPAVTASDKLGGSICLNQLDSLYSTSSGTGTPFTYLWSDPSGTGGLSSTSTPNSSVLPTVSGSYTFVITVTDNVGCAGTASVALTVSSHTAPTVTTTGSNVCLGSAITDLKASPSGGSGVYTYSWTATPSSTAGLNLLNSILQSPSPTPTAAGAYSYGVTVNDGFCNVPVTQAVTVYPQPTISAASNPGGTITICKNGVINLTSTPSGGTTPYGYVWSATPTGNGLVTTTTQNTTAKPSAGTYIYSVKLTDANNCTATASVTDIIIVNALATAPTVNASVSATSVCSNAVVNLTGGISAGTGASPYSYVWSGPSTISAPNSGSTTATSYNTTATPTSAGNYTLTVTDLNGCIGAASTANVAFYNRPTVSATDFATALCTNTKDTLYATATGAGTLNYAWSVSAPSGGTVTYAQGSTKATTGVTFNTVTGNYVFTVTVTDGGANSCTNTASVTIANTSNTGPTISAMNAAAIKCVGSTITLSPTVTAGTTSGTTVTKLTPVATSGNNLASNCASFAYANAFDGNTSTVYANYSPGSTYPNYYSGFVYADLGTANKITQLTFYPVAGYESAMNGGNFYGTNTNPSGGNFASATLLYTIPSTPAAGLNTVTSILSTTAFQYIVYQGPQTGSSYNPCGNSGLLYSVVADIGLYTGSTSTTPVGIASYLWSGSPTTGNGLGATNTQNTTAAPTVKGSYTYALKVTDNAGCVATATTGTQTVNSAVSVSAQAVTSAFCGTSATDQLFAIVSGGSGTYSTYAWTTTVVTTPGSTTLNSSSIYNPVASISSATVASSFKYGVTVTDNNACQGTATTAAIPVVSAPTVTSVTGTSASTCANSTNTIKLSASFSSGTAPYNWTWTPPSNSTMYTSSGTATSAGTVKDTATATVAQNYSYGFTIEDANNCVATGFTSTLITVNTGLTMTATTSNVGPICANPATPVNLTSTVSGGSGIFTYAWSGSGSITSPNAQNTSATPNSTNVFTLNASDNNGCTGTANTQIITVDQATPSISVTCGTNSAGINYLQFNELNGNTWLWTTTSGGRFYTSSALSDATDGTTSTSQAPYVTYNGTYNVQITDAAGCIGSAPFVIQSNTCSVVLAVSNLNFTAVKQDNTALLNWSTSTEVNNNRFDIERSSDGVNWQVIGTVKAKGNSTTLTKYSFTDATPLNGTNYYRIKQVDDDARFSYSIIKPLVFTGQWLVKLYPNPVQNFIVLEFNNDKDEKAAIVIQSASGSTIFTTEQQLIKGFNRITLTQIQRMAQGTYLLTLGTSENIFRSKFVKGGN